MDKFFVDRVEDGVVICEDENGDEVRFGKADIRGSVREGDVICKDEGANMYVDAKATEERRKEIIELRKYVYKTKSK